MNEVRGLAGLEPLDSEDLGETTRYGRNLATAKRASGEREYMQLARAAFATTPGEDLTPAQYRDNFEPAIRMVAGEISSGAGTLSAVAESIYKGAYKALMQHPSKRPEAFRRLGQIAKRIEAMGDELRTLNVEMRGLK